MGVHLSAYVEEKTDKGWKMVSKESPSHYLESIFSTYSRDFRRENWDNLSDGLKKKYPKEEKENICYATFYVSTIEEIESKINANIHDIFTRLNLVLKALGSDRIYNDDGEESAGYESESESKMTIPINKALMEDVQYGYSAMREIGQQEAFTLFMNQYIDDYSKSYRIVFVAS